MRNRVSEACCTEAQTLASKTAHRACRTARDTIYTIRKKTPASGYIPNLNALLHLPAKDRYEEYIVAQIIGCPAGRPRPNQGTMTPGFQ